MRGEGFIERSLRLLTSWMGSAEAFWYPIPGQDGLGCYGTGFGGWGVQTNQKYLGAMAALSVLGERAPLIPRALAGLARERALAALRFSLRSHNTGDVSRPDGTQWGHTWISVLGVERMMYGVNLLMPYLTGGDRADLRRVLVSECDWLLEHYHRGSVEGVAADPWNHTGKNAPESNIWNGAVLWRTACLYPDHPDAEAWRQRAHLFLMNGVSVPSDAKDEGIVAGKRVRDWHVGASFFPHYALDHHGYMNVGYMVICLSNAAMLHFDLKAQGAAIPESLYLHNRDLWHVVRRMVFGDGRLARIGGDSRIRYVYCQEYLLPSLVYAADHLGEEQAGHLATGLLDIMEEEAAYNGDGSFYGRRLSKLIDRSPYYYTRLESDRACALGMLATYLYQNPGAMRPPEQGDGSRFEASAAGSWMEPEHGDVLHRSPTRLASFSWRAHGLTQGMCQPPDDGHLAEWQYNLAGSIRFLGDDSSIQRARNPHRRLEGYRIDSFGGGFVTSGAVTEGIGVVLEEQYVSGDSAHHQIAFAALPDAHTVVGLQHCQTLGVRTYLAEVKGLHLNLPNDLYNGFRRQLFTDAGELLLACPPEHDRLVELGPWVNVEGRLGVAGIYGAEKLVAHQSATRRGGRFESLYVDEICYPCLQGTRAVEPETVILDAGWAVLSGAGVEETRRFVGEARAIPLSGAGCVRAVSVVGLDGVAYVVAANFCVDELVLAASDLLPGAESARDLISDQIIARGGSVRLAPRQCRVLAIG